MKKELELFLVNEFPSLFRHYGGDPKKTCMARGCEHGDGWFNLLYELCLKITDKDPNNEHYFSQIKEKYGRLTVYIRHEGGIINIAGVSKEINQLVDHYEELSEGICEKCGTCEKVTNESVGWYNQSLCEDCRGNLSWKYKT